MKRSVRRAIAAVVGLLFAAAALGALPTLTDDRGVAVAIHPPARRIVTLAPSVTELAFAAGAGERVVGVSTRSDYPAAAARLPIVAGPGRIDVERVLALAPDLVLAWTSGNPQRDLARLEQRGVRVYAIEPRRVADIARALRAIGTLAGTQAIAHAAADDFEREVASATPMSGARLRVFFEIWHDPLVTVSDAHLIGDLLGRCGGANVFGDAVLLTPRVSREALYRADPDAIVSSTGVADRATALKTWRDLRWLRAVEAGRVYAVDATVVHRQGPRLVEGLRAVCQALDQARAGCQDTRGRTPACSVMPRKRVRGRFPRGDQDTRGHTRSCSRIPRKRMRGRSHRGCEATRRHTSWHTPRATPIPGERMRPRFVRRCQATRRHTLACSPNSGKRVRPGSS